ncbi:hypothetical protein ABHF91_01275 [Pseudaeromonas sp. ZJS20]|uniref:helix-turn-helix domain-containing transcriptional regulator n=1 Tax=Pseudaeromonas aegiceratis TaxID=3153928 RepID=UPI00390C7B97
MGTLKELMDQLSPESHQRVRKMADEMLMKATFRTFDPANYLQDEEHRQAYLEAAREEGDPTLLAKAHQNVERSRANTSASAPGDQGAETDE